ncbi:uncharacterized protein ARMOST_05841 [Armillaria ostoyae]|uniref:Uncharacterized protein n=2 Tax=Armillaria TaxID=47424 RepID=A0A284R1C5_ARMOS|nr:hypothetical protein ARMSODRAFT_959690 [Armillaria solidipes]SJL02510.1 uncharacterized protein ARMOST_05841 [Armillaria ostoyae]
MGIIDGLVYRKYDIIDKQKFWQADTRAVHFRAPGRAVKLRLFYGTFAFTAAYAVYGVTSLILGKK